ncbi:MAG: hypothetical protein KDB11_11695 [Planctomycetales bacterium]|nr:hypothetical protein [Planctomycetales bacterium]
MRRTLCFLTAFCVAVSVFSVAHVRAESPLELARAAKGQSRIISADDVAASKARLQQSVQVLESHLRADGEEHAAELRALLHLEAMQAELEKEGTPSLEVLNRSLVAYRENHEGLELKAFTDVRDSLRAYMNHLVFSSADGFSAEFDRRIDELVAQLEAYEAGPTTKLANEIGRTLGWFDRAEQIASVTSAIRAQYSHPNLYVVASKPLVASSVRDAVEAAEPLRDCVMGTSIHGTTYLNGNIDLELVPSDERAAFDITLIGNAVSNNVGYNRNVSIYSTGYTNLNASKRVYFDMEGVTSDWATATAATSTHVSSIAAKCRIVRNIAWKQVNQRKSQAEAIASRMAAGRVAARVDGQAGERLAEAEESYQGKFRAPLVRRESFPERFELKTTDSELLVQLLRAGSFQLAAPGPAPELGGEFDLAARVHESIAGNFSESIIGGVMLTDTRIVEMYQEAEMEVPADLVITNDSDPWAITFARSQPISVEFVNGDVNVAILCQSLHQGDGYSPVSLLLKDEATEKLFRPDIKISREYELTTPNDGGLQLVSKGDLKVEFIELNGEPAKSYGARHAAAVGLLSKKFNAMLKPKLPEEPNDGITFDDERWKRIGKLKARLAKAADGWLQLGWEQVLPDAPTDEAIADGGVDAADAVVDESEANESAELLQTASLAP